VSVRIRLLGGLAVDGFEEHALGSRKGRRLLEVLALAGGTPVSTDRLAEVLWGDDAPARPAEQIGVLVSRLRGVLGADRIVRTDAGYRLVADWLDLAELELRVAEAASAMDEGRLGAARAAAGAAVALARGELLPGAEGDWVEAARAVAAATVGRAHQLATEAAAAAGDHAGAAASAEAALAVDPYDEVALRLLMRAHAAAGRPASALAAYVRVRERVVDDLGVDLTVETEALHDALVLEPGAPPAEPVVERPVVGRDAELGELATALDHVRPGGAGLVVVRGEAGVGKSALVQAFVAGRPAAVVLRGRCDELGRDLPLQPLVDAVADHLRTVGPEAADALLGADAASLTPLLGWEAAAGATTVADAEAGRATLFAALLAVISRAGAGAPVVLVVDDLHLAGASTLAWCAFARRRGQRLLVVATCRPGAPPPTDAVVIDLAPLGREAVAELLPGIDDARLDELHRRAGGNPLFLLALAVADVDELPATVRDAVDAQAAGLGDGGATVRTAASLGTEVDLDLLAEVLRRPAIEVLGALEEAVASGLLVERGVGFTFAHDLVREALDAGAGGARRALAHRDAARALAARPVVDALTVAVHARLGGDVALATDAFVQAAREASARFDTDAALAHLDAAVALGGSAACFVERARVRMATVQLDEAAADAAEAVERGGGAAALEVSSWVAYYRRRYDEARTFAAAGHEAAGDDEALRSSCQLVLGRILHGGGDLRAAAATLEAVVGAPAAVQGTAAVWLGHVRMHEGSPAEALAVLEEPLARREPLAHPWAGLHGRFARTVCLGYQGRLALAVDACDDLDAAVAAAGTVGARFRGPAANARGWLLRYAGSPGAADGCNEVTLALTSGPDGGPASDAVSEYHYVALLDLADGRLLAGDPVAAAALVGRLAPVDTWTGTMAWHQRHRLGLLRSRLALLDGDADGAAGFAAGVVDDAEARGSRRYAVLARARLSLATGDVGPVDGLVGALSEVAGLEAWRLLLELADGLALGGLLGEAERRAEVLLGAAGDLADGLRADLAAAFG
jgi:DNA-binding SARP family transcriptional activator